MRERATYTSMITTGSRREYFVTVVITTHTSSLPVAHVRTLFANDARDYCMVRLIYILLPQHAVLNDDLKYSMDLIAQILQIDVLRRKKKKSDLATTRSPPRTIVNSAEKRRTWIVNSGLEKKKRKNYDYENIVRYTRKRIEINSSKPEPLKSPSNF